MASSSGDPDAGKESHGGDPSWEAFRSLCRYYADCLELESGGRPRVQVDELEEKAVMLEDALPWRDLAAGQRVVVRGGDALSELIRRSTRPSQGPRLRIGGPLELYKERRGDIFVIPAFTIPVLVERNGGQVVLRAEGPARINEAWLEAQFQRGRVDQRDNLLIELGVYDERLTLEGVDVEVAGDQTLEQLWHRLLRVQSQKFCEIGGPDRLQSSPRLTPRSSLGLYNRACLIADSDARFVGGNLAELRTLSRQPDDVLRKTALASFFTTQPARGQDGLAGGQEPCAPEFKPLNKEQREAVLSTFEGGVTAVQGPPGTGKSMVVTHVLAAHALAGQSALFASRNHRAIDAVVPKLKAIDPDQPLILRLTPSKTDPDTTEDDWLASLLDFMARPHDPEAAELVLGLLSELRSALKSRAEHETALQDYLASVESLGEVNQRIEKLEGKASAEALALRILSPERLQARTVRSLSARLDPDKRGLWARLQRSRAGARIEKLYVARCRDVDSDALAAAEPPSTPSNAAEILLQASELSECDREVRTLEQETRVLSPKADLVDELERADEIVRDLTKKALTLFASTIGARQDREFRAELANIRGVLGRTRNAGNLARLRPNQRLAVERAFERAVGVFPLWACSSLSVSSRLPLVAGAFDLVVIDEASQCDIPSCLPLLFRAKRAMIVGDPMQLRHMGKVALEVEDRLREHHGVDGVQFGRFRHSTNSIWEPALASAVGEKGTACMLREHWRCHPAIAGYVSELFYDDQLRVRTVEENYPPVVRGGRKLRGIEWTHVEGGSESVAGSRTHAPQVDAIVEELARLAENGFDGSVGLVTPFRVHADRIRTAVAQRVPASTLKQWHFIAETADGFQGDERDLIIFGLVGGPEPEDTPQFYLRERNRFNVAVSRARSLLHVFGDRDWARASGEPVLTRLYETWEDWKRESELPMRADLIGPVWEPRLADEMRRAGIEFHQQFRTCGFYLDFAVLGPGMKIDIEVDGETYHRGSDGGLRTEDIRRDQLLKAAGWRVLRFWVYELRENMERCIARIKEEIEDGDN